LFFSKPKHLFQTIDMYIYALYKERQTQIQTITSFKQKIRTEGKMCMYLFMTVKA